MNIHRIIPIDGEKLYRAIHSRDLTALQLSKEMHYERSYLGKCKQHGKISAEMRDFLEQKHGIAYGEYEGEPVEEKPVLNCMPIDGDKLKDILHQKGKTCREVSLAMGYERTYLDKRRRVGLISPAAIQFIEKRYNIPYDAYKRGSDHGTMGTL